MEKNIELSSCLTPKQAMEVFMLLDSLRETTGMEVSLERLVSDSVRYLITYYKELGPWWYAGFNHGSNRHYVAEMRGEY